MFHYIVLSISKISNHMQELTHFLLDQLRLNGLSVDKTLGWNSSMSARDCMRMNVRKEADLLHKFEKASQIK